MKPGKVITHILMMNTHYATGYTAKFKYYENVVSSKQIKPNPQSWDWMQVEYSH